MYKTIIHLGVCVFVISVKCDRKADLKCVSDGNAALKGLNDQQLYDLSQKDLNEGSEMVKKRVAVSKQQHLDCYVSFYASYIPKLSAILQTSLKDRLATAKTPIEKTGALKAIASLTQSVICDEKWRALHANDMVECSAKESATKVLNTQFNARLTALKGAMFLGGFVGKIKNQVMAHIVTDMRKMYTGLYEDAYKCSQHMSGANKCLNMKKLVLELERLFYLGGLSIETKFLSFLTQTPK